MKLTIYKQLWTPEALEIGDTDDKWEDDSYDVDPWNYVGEMPLWQAECHAVLDDIPSYVASGSSHFFPGICYSHYDNERGDFHATITTTTSPASFSERTAGERKWAGSVPVAIRISALVPAFSRPSGLGTRASTRKLWVSVSPSREI